VPTKVISLDDYRQSKAGTSKAASIAGEQLEISVEYPTESKNKKLLIGLFDAFAAYVRAEMQEEITETK
jgi:hypothetical protein